VMLAWSGQLTQWDNEDKGRVCLAAGYGASVQAGP